MPSKRSFFFKGEKQDILIVYGLFSLSTTLVIHFLKFALMF